ncbi:SDR family oxidoreductase [Deinococcus radiophilus]|uniref:SDR family oxidoreductase n=1 Tax=Deinococcus radiophilus TaxID=32062 RepID=A0A3S0RET0_9DEIO|nr:SDR family oxidoreductase [Deinococcus radiophilus]RTR26668.1 SDR family oxidoreductase [Deinococcus radiophilus]UFA51004.1 SDR family oxidoreductase [Deinococcus radiophilus]
MTEPARRPSEGPTTLITGATEGIGLATAAELVRRGQRVLLLGRNPEKLAAAQQETGAAATYRADLSELHQVAQVASEIRDQEGRIDVLINNAGGIFDPRQETREGIEMTWALNVLSPFLLTRELLPALRQSDDPRIITLASDAHRMARLDLSDPEMKRGYSAWPAYNASKLANVLLARELARRERWLGSAAVHPGVVRTGFNANNATLQARLWALVDLGAISPEEGAQTSVYLASTPQTPVSGTYWAKSKPTDPAPIALDDGLALRLWETAEDYLQRLGL